MTEDRPGAGGGVEGNRAGNKRKGPFLPFEVPLSPFLMTNVHSKAQ